MRGAMSGGLVRVDDEGEGGCRVCDKDDDQEWTVFEGCVREGGSRKSEGCARSVNNQRLEAVRAWKQKY